MPSDSVAATLLSPPPPPADLVVLPPAPDASPFPPAPIIRDEEVASARAYVERSRAASTRRAYETDWPERTG